MSDSRLVLGIVAFYVALYYLLGGVGVVTQESPWEIPTFPGTAATDAGVPVNNPVGFVQQVIACVGGILDSATLGLFGALVRAFDATVPITCSIANKIPIISDISGFFAATVDVATAIINVVVGLLNFALGFVVFLATVATFNVPGIDPLFTTLLLLPAVGTLVFIVTKTARGSGG